MAITVKPPLNIPTEPDAEISADDAALIAMIAERIGKIEAIRVTRWLTKCGIKTGKDFVDSLSPQNAQ